MSGVLLDTHALIWLLEEAPELGRKARQLADAATRENSVFVSAITFWEVALLTKRGRVDLKVSPGVWRGMALQRGVKEIPVSGDIGSSAADLADFHPDPADRIVTVTAILQGVTLITADGRILGWGGKLERHDAHV